MQADLHSFWYLNLSDEPHLAAAKDGFSGVRMQRVAISEPFLSLQCDFCPLTKTADPVLSVDCYIVNLHMYSCTVEHLHASFHFPVCQGRWVKLRPCFISSNEDRAKIPETVFLLPSKLFCSVPRANWNGLSVNWMRIDVWWDRDIWPTFDTCRSVQRGRYLYV